MLEIRHVTYNIGDRVDVDSKGPGTLLGWTTHGTTVELDDGSTVKVGFFTLSKLETGPLVSAHLIAVIKGSNSEFRVHAADCADVSREAKKFHDDPWVFPASSRHEINLACWGDVATDHTDDDSPEWHALCDEYAETETTYLPCCPVTE